MLRLLGILSLGNLFFGGHHHRRMMRRGLLLGAILGFLLGRNTDTDRVKEKAREKARDARRAAHEAAREARKALRNARKEWSRQRTAERVKQIHARIEERKAEREQKNQECLDAVRAEAEARRTGSARLEEKTVKEVQAEPVSMGDGVRIIRELGEDLERDARTAAMAASVPTIDFPEEDERYHVSGKYGYA